MKEKAKILIVEDEYYAARMLQKNLTRLGYQVCKPVATGEKALESVEKEQPDVILMDVRLAGGVDGIEVAQEIRARHGTPVIFMSGYAGRDILERAQELEPAAYLTKPIEMDEVVAIIDLLFDKSG